MTPLCELFAEVVAARFPQCAVYSNADANREWTGTPTIEFVETNATTETFLDSRSRQTRVLTCVCRDKTRGDATALASAARRAIANCCDALKRDERIAGWALDDFGALPDERGFVVGETFYGFVDFAILENISDYV